MRSHRQRASVLVQIILLVGIAILVLFTIKRQSIGTLVVHNASSQKISNIELHAINPTTQSTVDTIPVADLQPGTETEVSLESLQWHQVALELCQSPSNPVPIASRSEPQSIVPGGNTIKAQLTVGADGKLQVSSWDKE